MEQRIIGAKARRPGGAVAPALASAAPEVATSGTDAAARHVLVDEGGAGQRLDNFLVKLLKGVPKTHVYRVIRSGEVRVNKARADAQTRLALGDDVRVPPVRTAATGAPEAVPGREFPVLHEDADLLAIDKPAGVAVHGGSGVSFGVIEQLRRARPDARFLELVHRLDKETSGVLLIAKKRAALVALQAQMRPGAAGRPVAKTYLALVRGAWPAALKLIDAPLHKYLDAAGERRVRSVDADDAADFRARRAVTLVRVTRHYAGHTLLEVTLKTGRTHQIRVHLADAGHAIVGDDKYGDRAADKALARGEALAGVRFDRMFLHARRLRFEHPSTGAPLVIEAPLPAACTRLLDVLARAEAAAA